MTKEKTEPKADINPKPSIETETKQETEPQPDPMTDIMEYLQKQDKRIEQMEKSQTDLLQYLQDKFKSEGQQQQTQGDGTLGQLAGIAKTVMEGDKPATLEQQMMSLMVENFKLNNDAMRKLIYGKIENIERPSHRTV